ncbi:MAG TPA: hypothetical protein VF041_10510 [Gemmatimonadaceae bacterium]
MEHGNHAADRNEELRRVSAEVADRLAARGVPLSGREGPEELVELEDAIEEFEAAVEDRGGDLMVDEAPRGRTPQPDDPHFALPRRGEHESVRDYLARLERATDAVRQHPRRA